MMRCLARRSRQVVMIWERDTYPSSANPHTPAQFQGIQAASVPWQTAQTRGHLNQLH